MNVQRVRTPDGEGELVGRVIRDGKVVAVLVAHEKTLAELAEKIGAGRDDPFEVTAYPADQYFSVSDGRRTVLRRIG